MPTAATYCCEEEELHVALVLQGLVRQQKALGGGVARNTRVDPSDGDMAEEGSFMPFNSSSQFSEFKGLGTDSFCWCVDMEDPPLGRISVGS